MESIYEPIDGEPVREPYAPPFYTFPTRFNQEKYMPNYVLEKAFKSKKRSHDLGEVYGVPAFTDSTAIAQRFKWISEAKDLEATAMQIAKREVDAMRKVRRLASDLTQLIHSVDSIEELRAIITPKEGDSLSAYQNRIKSHVP